MAGPQFNTYQLVDAVDGSVVLVTQSLHALKAGGRTQGQLKTGRFEGKTLVLLSRYLGFVSLRIWNYIHRFKTLFPLNKIPSRPGVHGK